MLGRYSLTGALFLGWIAIASAQGQDSPSLSRALDRAERFDAAMGQQPQLTAKWLAGDRLAYSPAGKAPWTVLEGATGFALRGMLVAPDFFKVGYAGAPDDLTEAASINEPNMGLLASNQAGYDAGSNIGRASALRGRLKIMHGTSDVMAPLSTTMRMAQALIEANKTFDLLIMPGQPHGPQGAAGRYYREDVRRFMATHLLP
jgi:pimeloyl-ACP methyl ester carboxylesterase